MRYSLLPKEFRERKTEKIEDSSVYQKRVKKLSNIIALILATLFILLYIIYGTTSISLQDDGTTLTIRCTGGSEITVRYEDIISIEYAKELSFGKCLYNESKYNRFLCGVYTDETIGEFRLCVYESFHEYIILTTKEDTIVFNLGGQEATQAVYQALIDKCL